MAYQAVAPIATKRMGVDSSWTLRSYLQNGGYDALRKALTMSPEAVQAEVDKANLLGRGGAGFPAGRKWSMLRKADPVYLVVNGDESEPSTFKDHMLIEQDPHQIIEGALITAYAIKAQRVFLYVRGEFALGLERMQAALNEAYEHGAAGARIFGSDFSVDVIVHPGAGAYICGDETALLESLEGKRGYPRIKPPYYPAVIGLYGAPTVVNNVETMSNVPWIILNGGDAFAALGAPTATGTRLFSVAGRVNRPGNYEVELAKHTFRDLLYDPQLGGGIKDGKALRAFIPGGASSFWFGPERLDMPLDETKVKSEGGSMLGSGSVIALDETTCMVRTAWRIVRFFARESCGQCTPCREGGSWLEKIMYRVETGAGRIEDLDLLLDVCDNISPGVGFPSTWPPNMTTICPLGPSIPPPVVSAIGMFRDDFLFHIKEGRCPHD
ncbi:MAG TPA: NADH-ubiquinone oxidoreductase-F iron-sulfur binding region domain-containing protein [Acidimicrobiales bacterium]|nr:NADH-ubiquinone oxidoreductase-F iron-sulfur binding region domain-containing protein [Acidimicrobiales bacterium]